MGAVTARVTARVTRTRSPRAWGATVLAPVVAGGALAAVLGGSPASGVAAQVCSAPVQAVGTVQGAGAATPLAGTTVTVRGTVVGDYEGPSPALRGFYLQDAGDGDPATSDGVFVFADLGGASPDSVALGQVVEVTGSASEFQGQTQVSAASVTPCAASASVAPVDVTLPLAVPDALERYEGMLVRTPQTLTVTESFQLGRFGQVVVSSGGRLRQPTDVALPGPDAVALQAANALNRLIVDDATNRQNPDPIVFGRGGLPLQASNTLRIGDTVTGAVGVLTYTWAGNAASGNAYRLRPVGALGGTATFDASNPRPSMPPDVGDGLRVASANLLNFFDTFGATACTFGVGGPVAECRGASDEAEFQRQVAKTVPELLALDADVVGVNEVENDGYGPDSALARLVAELNAVAGPGTWAYVDVDAATGVVNATGTDAIKVALLYRPAAVSPVPGTVAAHTAAAATYERVPVAATFETPEGGVVSVVVNHWKSKGGCPASPADPQADRGDGQGCFNARRTDQARALLPFLDQVRERAQDPDVLVIGDLNSYSREDPVRVLEGAGFTLLGDPDDHSYVFDGQSGSLDHVLASPGLAAGQVTGAAPWHVNADEPSVLDYTVDFKSPGQRVSLYAPDQFRSSDHDPLVVALDPAVTERLVVSTAADGSGAVVLAGSTLTRDQQVSVVLRARDDVRFVVFRLDGRVWGVDGRAPWSLTGDRPGGSVRPFPVRLLAAGPHTLEALVVRADGSRDTVEAAFTVTEP